MADTTKFKSIGIDVDTYNKLKKYALMKDAIFVNKYLFGWTKITNKDLKKKM